MVYRVARVFPNWRLGKKTLFRKRGNRFNYPHLTTFSRQVVPKVVARNPSGRHIRPHITIVPQRAIFGAIKRGTPPPSNLGVRTGRVFTRNNSRASRNDGYKRRMGPQDCEASRRNEPRDAIKAPNRAGRQNIATNRKYNGG